ncbi:MAG: SRPBCC family protein [Chloroflexota bacterium]
MATHQFSESALIQAPAKEVYHIIADYQDGHDKILPKPPFVSLEVEEGGIGAGTVIQVTMRVMGRLQTFGATITEPEPGRVLVETNDTGYVTTFTVDPRETGQQAYVTIATEMPNQGGIGGLFERWLVPRMLRPVYVKELGKLEEVAMQRVG